MELTRTKLPGVLILEPKVFTDERGFFTESYNKNTFKAATGIDTEFVQDNHSRSQKGTLRGLHLQLENAQDKLVRVTRGEVFDVAVDVRKDSPTFGVSVCINLSESNFKQLYVPAGYAHGFLVLSDEAEFQYKCTNFYDPTSERSVAWDDPELNIPWPIKNPSLSAKDKAALPAREAL